MSALASLLSLATRPSTIATRQIDRRLKRTNGCEIDDWQRAVPLVPRAPTNVTP